MSLYHDLRALAQGKKRRKIDNNTYVELHGNYVVIRLHKTPILTVKKNDSKFWINTNGFMTTTTKARLNKYLPSGYKIFQKQFAWFVKCPVIVLSAHKKPADFIVKWPLVDRFQAEDPALL